ncbi:D-tyrosyl-tRNA(Tyr) deacylase [[Synechococcus] sp. NIES-970]|uniref:D-aminoacyl-tRNA deacylase n=1 Tax=Picosynechococcus sp. NKBG15041c TaxID=1407650 RepID=UPI00040D3877|nr:D-aminoacyl-tRNA deacylase [Picosynechococcus sp. NKBG15041c]BAW95160.1 D-tyrosyl-tRNA(Tyr) deacylase [[Synechococcus] sp. NIES-970]
MKIVLQRVNHSQVLVAGQIVGQIQQGYTLLVGFTPSDTQAELQWLARKCLDLRLFPDSAGNPWQCSIQDIQGEILVVSQFTLYGDCRKGRRPSFSAAAAPEQAEILYEQFVTLLRESGLKIQTGRFGSMMQVEISNDGPVTLVLEREAL